MEIELDAVDLFEEIDRIVALRHSRDVVQSPGQTLHTQDVTIYPEETGLGPEE